MNNIIRVINWSLYGGIWSNTYEQLSDGGPKCFNELTVQFRFTMCTISVIINSLIVYFSWPSIKKCRELNLDLVKNLNPNIFEKLLGYASYITYLIICYYKFASGRGVFMLNPCHIVLLFQAFLLTTKKTQFSAIIYITYCRWWFCPWFALLFPSLDGLDLPYEVYSFYLEHYIEVCLPPVLLFVSGRYGFFKETPWMIIKQQYFGFAIHSMYMRIIPFPVSLLTWANINFILCHSEADVLYWLVGDYYLYFVDHYLNAASIVIFIVVLIIIGLVQIFVVMPYRFYASKNQTKEFVKHIKPE